MNDLDNMTRMRTAAALAANTEDGAVWRWFSSLMEERRIRWCLAGEQWLVSVDHRHVSTNRDFDSAIRTAKENVGHYLSGGREKRQRRKTSLGAGTNGRIVNAAVDCET
ncbi:hypothetical protein [Paraburkholderia sp. J7]|uniref:hypothetical protein n=1 Tax=Paraburkholderia sp. J7 TaxID=2805438 RepID=UPI002AB6CB0C|nr:hypothetical protein [Paraburkholderia sp. J7]